MVKILNPTHRLTLLALAVALPVLGLLYSKGVVDLVWQWDNREEYSHGYLIPVVVGYFIWQRRGQLQHCGFRPTWMGCLCVLCAALLYVVGKASVLYVLIQYSLVLALIGLAWALMGHEAVKIVMLPLLMLFFAIPLPEYLDVLLSSKLQLISTSLGVSLIQWCKIPVYQDGNLIDLGVYKLQVVEACSGLRYLFPLLSIGFICVYLFKAALWKRALVFFSCIPITILMNSFRIGMIGILVNSWGIAMAEGFLHDFEGWLVYMVCLAILILEMMLINAFTRPRKSFAEVFTVAEGEPVQTYAPAAPLLNDTLFAPPVLGAVALLVGLAIMSLLQGDASEVIPLRQNFKSFPLQLDSWHGINGRLPADQLKILKLTDYVLSDYRSSDQKVVNFYAAYYESQKRRAAPHSPKVCIPGGGWEITDMSRIEVAGHPVNRLMIKKGLQKQLVYYWYQQRGKIVANEFAMKWHLFLDALFLNRTDGALVRLTTEISTDEAEVVAEQRLRHFFDAVEPVLDRYVPK